MSGTNFNFDDVTVDFGNECFWNFHNLGDGGTEIIVGETFFKQFYTIFDSENSQIGFGLAQATQGSIVGPWFWYSTEKGSVDSPTSLAVVSLCSVSVIVFIGISVVLLKLLKKG